MYYYYCYIYFLIPFKKIKIEIYFFNQFLFKLKNLYQFAFGANSRFM